ncbi:DgyrCDS1337 [Dimorphilus gyrociliatus]|uniref:DgyrCDS1337 n=1 Tax=Dimorphilus gyrociliatus TaxID=2664684 RepID=A0A7I8V6Z0_9ANNE|nr:DgyrCDS1337 [Dimorphilus gyrociliatus]
MNNKIFIQIDLDNNKRLNRTELFIWFRTLERRRLALESIDEWNDYVNFIKNGELTWSDYKTETFDNDKNNELMRRDKNRWLLADKNHSGTLDFEEWHVFLHPEDFSFMSKVVVDEALNDLDEDDDERISLQEFIGINHNTEDMDEEDEKEIEHLEREFRNIRDKDNDGYLNRDEVREWSMIDDTKFTDSKVDDILDELDLDKNENLDSKELVNFSKHFDIEDSRLLNAELDTYSNLYN